MKRSNSTTPAKIWSFGALAPTHGAELVEEQLKLANRYYNKLVELERARRERYRVARSRLAPALGLLEETERVQSQVVDAHAEIVKAANAKSRNKRGATSEQKEALKEARARLKVTRAQLREERKKANDSADLKTESEEINVWANAEHKKFRASSGVYWGTYLLVEKAAEAMRKSTEDPRFRRYTGDGRIGVQIQNGLTKEALLSCADTRLRLEHQWTGGRGGRRKGWTLWIRVGSDGVKPVWAKFPVVTHRDIPDGALIKEAWVLVRREGSRTTYNFQLVMRSEEFSRQYQGNGVAAINFGWRIMDDGDIRVGYVVDEYGDTTELIMPGVIRDRLAYADKLRGISDLCFNVALGVANGLRTAGIASEEWLKSTDTIAQWKSHSRLSKAVTQLVAETIGQQRADELWDLWCRERLEATPKLDLLGEFSDVYEFANRHQPGISVAVATVLYLEWWRHKDQHLYDWELRQRAKARCYRRDIYRNYAAKLAARYSTLLHDNAVLKDFLRKPKPGEDTQSKDHLHKLQADTAPSELRKFISEVFCDGFVVVKHPSASKTCSKCGERVESGDWSQRVQVCHCCGHEFDQDVNHCKNLLAEYAKQS